MPWATRPRLSTTRSTEPRRLPSQPAAESASGELFLSAIPPEVTAQNAGWLRFDRNQAGQPIRIGRRTYERGLGTQAVSHITYMIGPYRWFAADIGIDAAVGPRGSALFKVQVDGVTKFATRVQGGQPAVPVRVDLSRGHALALVVLPNTDSNVYDWADWAQARLIRDVNPAPPTP